jgi:hypothetical protein
MLEGGGSCGGPGTFTPEVRPGCSSFLCLGGFLLSFRCLFQDLTSFRLICPGGGVDSERSRCGTCPELALEAGRPSLPASPCDIGA